MKKLIDNWVHIPGIHCGSVTLRDVATFYGYPWSEPMCFGIGGGLGFYYTVRDDVSPSHMIFMRGPGMEPSFFSLVDKPTDWKHGGNHALNVIKESLDKKVPVIIQTDIYYLDYYESSTHFPGHIVSVWGYDDEAEKMLIADNHFEGLKEVPYVKFLKGMGSKDSSNPLDYNYIAQELRDLKPLEELIPLAIAENARKMLDGVIGGRGESGVRLIRKWTEDLLNWHNVEDWKWCARFGYQVIKKRGVGGAGFRWIYRDFLKEAEVIVPTLKELNLSGDMDSIGQMWSSIAELLKEISIKDEPDRDLLRKASDRAFDIWDSETEYYQKALKELSR